MNRVFLLGDSFTDNLYQECVFHIKMNLNVGRGQVRKFVDSIIADTGNPPLWFSDWLKIWGLDVHNFGLGGCSIYHTFNQFVNIPKNFIEGDRIIVNWTSPIRLDWIVEGGDVHIIQGTFNNYKDKPDAYEALLDQNLRRMYSIENTDNKGYLRKQTIPFMSRLVELHEKYKPIQWSPFDNISDFISSYPYYFYEPSNPIFKDWIKEWDILKIYGESDGKCDDAHYSRYGNYYAALIFKTILEAQSDCYYINNNNLLDRVFDVVKNNRPNLPFVNWKNKIQNYL